MRIDILDQLVGADAFLLCEQASEYFLNMCNTFYHEVVYKSK
jgi:hypothetical protein